MVNLRKILFMSVIKQYLTPKQKALAINLDPNIYGTFAEIGAGQETVRHFFRAGAASQTIAKANLLMIRTTVMLFMVKKTK